MPRKSGKPAPPQSPLHFDALVEAVRQVHEHSAAMASRAVNVSLTLRNWAIGYYIREYEQNGADRAKYGARLLESLSDALTTAVSESDPRGRSARQIAGVSAGTGTRFVFPAGKQDAGTRAWM